MEEQPWIFTYRTTPEGEQPGDEQRWVRVTKPTVPYPIGVRVAKSSEGRIVCTGLRLGVGAGSGPPGPEVEITARSLRDIKVSEILTEIANDADLPPHIATALGVEGVVATVSARVEMSRPGPKGHPREFFERVVAPAYREALIRSPRNPYKHMAGSIPTSEPTARRWVQRARDMSILGDPIPGKAGERPPSVGEEEHEG